MVDEQRPDSTAFRLRQFETQRREIDNRTQLQHQLVIGALVAAGTFISIGIAQDAIDVMLVYPILALFIATAWMESDRMIHEIATHIAELEREILGEAAETQGWENWVDQRRREGKILSAYSAPRGIFLGTQLLAIIAALFHIRAEDDISLSAEYTTLVLFDVLVVLVTLVLLVRWASDRAK